MIIKVFKYKSKDQTHIFKQRIRDQTEGICQVAEYQTSNILVNLNILKSKIDGSQNISSKKQRTTVIKFEGWVLISNGREIILRAFQS